ncbi:hypothetical protein GWK47_016990 [Chionoecetes opilio]|uniref:Pacifastin domain-containing protein n=1 Tax=Chionoecetes opilio TaxID=41210 RepID=A0A8J4XW98_CHIOP|nr:hypothetical protein GWK47_016990 [Chionoecetes opilio]
MKECNRCSCANGTAVCTLKFCGASPARPTLLRGRPEPACQGDSKTDTWTFKCNKCRCRNGLATCTKRLCRRGEKDLPVCQGNPIWRKDCNRCHCHNGTAVCTSKYCGPMASQTRTAVRPPGLVSKDKRVCEDGSRWRVDCNWCSCRGGVALCTLKGCLRPSDEPDCEGDATWKQDCNWCTCGGGLALCTRMACLKEGELPQG